MVVRTITLPDATDNFGLVRRRDHAKPYPRGVARRPRQYPSALVEGWPDAPSDDAAVEVARLLSCRLREAMNGRSARDVGRTAGIDYTTVSAVLNGTTWPDLMTIARLEAALGCDLWPAGIAARAAGSVAQ